MYETVFSTILRSVAIPIIFFFILENTFLSEEQSFLAVTITLTLLTVISLFFQILSILPKLMLLKGKKLVRLSVRIFIEILALFGFWYYYLLNFV